MPAHRAEDICQLLGFHAVPNQEDPIGACLLRHERHADGLGFVLHMNNGQDGVSCLEVFHLDTLHRLVREEGLEPPTRGFKGR